MSTRRRLALIAGSAPLAVLVFLFAAWGIDTAVSGDRVVRNVEVDGISLGGLDRGEVEAVAGDLSDGLDRVPVRMDGGSRQLESDALAMGVRVDDAGLAEAALDARRGGFVLARPFRWVQTFFSTEEIGVDYVLDREATLGEIDRLIGDELSDPIEPTIELRGTTYVATPGSNGASLDAAEVANTLAGELRPDASEYEFDIDLVLLEPELPSSELTDLADELNAVTANELVVSIEGFGSGVATDDEDTEDEASDDETEGDDVVTIRPIDLRTWVELSAEPGAVGWSLDADAIGEWLEPRFTGLGDENQQARFNVVDEVPVIIPADETVVCCDDDSADRIRAAMEADAGEVELATRVTTSDAGVAELQALGIIEQVATFTTNHSCCENRVTNIHLIADEVRGVVILPGERFSLNEHVGRRTSGEGYLPAGAIAQGVLEAQVGGGVSQFATTIFNAAFFAGLDFIEYQSHSLYFSRYPRGREATISWPKPDLVLENNTDYAVLVWPTYTDTSITVSMYSTTNVEVTDKGRSEGSRGFCTVVTTFRERVFSDGTVDNDSVFGVYRPAAGRDCNNNPTRPDLEPSTTTTVAGDGGATTTAGDGGGETTTTVGGGDTTATTAPPATTATTAPPATTTTAAAGDGG